MTNTKRSIEINTDDTDFGEVQRIIDRINAMMREFFSCVDYEVKRRTTVTCHRCQTVIEVPETSASWIKADIGCKECGAEVTVFGTPISHLLDDL